MHIHRWMVRIDDDVEDRTVFFGSVVNAKTQAHVFISLDTTRPNK